MKQATLASLTFDRKQQICRDFSWQIGLCCLPASGSR